MLEVKGHPDDLDLRARVQGDDGRWISTAWHPTGAVTGWIELEWRRSLEGLDDGFLEVRHEGTAVLGIDAVDNDGAALTAVAVAELKGDLVVLEISELE